MKITSKIMSLGFRMNSLETEETPLIGTNYHRDGNFSLTRKGILALALILIAQFSERIAYYTTVVWFPDGLHRAQSLLNMTSAPNQPSTVIMPSLGVLYLLSPLAGLLTDNVLKKSRALLIGSLLALAGYLIVTWEVSVLTEFTCYNETRCSYEPMLVKSGVVRNEWAVIYYSAIVISLVSSFMEVGLPALGCDQICIRAQQAGCIQPRLKFKFYKDKVQTFNAAFYWSRKLGELFAACAALVLLRDHDLSNAWRSGLITFAAIIAVTAVLMFTMIVIVIPNRWCPWLETREPDSGSYFRDTVRIYKNAFQNRDNKEGSGPFSCLNAAKSQQDGNFSDKAVDERISMAKLLTVTTLLLPMAFVMNCVDSAPFTGALLPEVKIYGSGWLTIVRQIILMTPIGIASSVFFIPVLHFTYAYLRTRTNIKPKLVWRIVAGHITLSLALVMWALFPTIQDSDSDNGFEHQWVMYISLILQGLSKALIYTAGYEIALLLSSRSSQSLAIGIFKLADGLASALGIVATTPLLFTWPFDDLYKPSMIMIALLACAAVLITICHKRLNLGLSA